MESLRILLFSFFFLAQISACCSTNLNTDSGGSDQNQNEFELIMEKIRACKVEAPSDSVIKQLMDNMTAEGGYPDIDYASTVRTGWVPQLHYYRLRDMAFAYISPLSSWYSNDTLYNKIVKGTEYWIAAKSRSINWYQQQVDEPLSWGLILITMRAGEKKMPASLEEQIIEKWRNNGADPANFTSSNRAEISLHWLYFSCLTEDAEKLGTALNYIFEPIKYTDYEGFQVDNSFLQHGQQIYIGGYGEHLIESVLQAAYCVAGTQFQLPEEKLVFIRNYVLNTFANVIRGQVMNWSCSGRTITHPGYLKDQSERIPPLKKLIELDKEYADEYNAIINRLLGVLPPSGGIRPSHQHFYRADYTVHVRPDYSFSTRMVSTRTARQEYMNGENLLTYFLSDGATEIKMTGEEYFDLMPFWDWNKIPGVTAPILDAIPLAPDEYNSYGSSTFVGGVSDSIYGCSTYSYYDDYNGVNTGASKGYFFFDNEVVCLGAGITSDHNSVFTTINQCWGHDGFIVGSSSGMKEYQGETMDIELEVKDNWVLHDGVGYYIPDHQTLSIENITKTGNWRWISNSQEDKELSGKVFTLCIKHQPFVKDGKYSYIIIPNSTSSSLRAYSANKQIEILSNTDSVQIVRHKGLKLIECIFYKACTFQGNGVTIDAQQPCALLIKDNGGNITVNIADPSQSKQRMGVGIQLEDMAGMLYGYCDFTTTDYLYAGMAKTISISKQTTSVACTDANTEFTFTTNPYTVVFDRICKGVYSLWRLDGVALEKIAFESDHINFPISQKGLYLLNLAIEGKDNSIIRRIIVK